MLIVLFLTSNSGILLTLKYILIPSCLPSRVKPQVLVKFILSVYIISYKYNSHMSYLIDYTYISSLVQFLLFPKVSNCLNFLFNLLNFL